MSKRPLNRTPAAQVYNLYKRLAGDKLSKCDEVAEGLVQQGYKQERAWAEALDVYKCVKNDSVEEDNVD